MSDTSSPHKRGPIFSNPHRHVARKRFGQHFLVDAHYIGRIVSAVDPQRGDNLVEIGPGLGALTRPLLERVERLAVIEIDRDLAARLADEYPPGRLTLYNADALDFDFGSLGPELRVVGNLPYNISSPLLFHLAQYEATLVDLFQRGLISRQEMMMKSQDPEVVMQLLGEVSPSKK